jgi:hypothetical protein
MASAIKVAAANNWPVLYVKLLEAYKKAYPDKKPRVVHAEVNKIWGDAKKNPKTCAEVAEKKINELSAKFFAGHGTLDRFWGKAALGIARPPRISLTVSSVQEMEQRLRLTDSTNQLSQSSCSLSTSCVDSAVSITIYQYFFYRNYAGLLFVQLFYIRPILLFLVYIYCCRTVFAA